MVAQEILFTLAAKSITALGKAFVSIREKYSEEIDRIGDSFGDPQALAQLYIQPFGQNVNPADYREEVPGAIIKRPIIESLFEFFSGPRTISEQQNKAIVLADSGMGKTSLLVMLKLLQLNAFFPKGYECVLLKIGPSVLDEIKAIDNRNNKILLLDSLDEDPVLSRVAVEDRIREVFSAARHFRRVVMTCRSQFFPKRDKDPFKVEGFVQVGDSRFMCIFISPFTDQQVQEYLEKKFPGGWMSWFKQNQKLEDAKSLMALMKDLRFRPMLLSNIDLILKSNEKCWNEFTVYRAMRESWIAREKSEKPTKLTVDEIRELNTRLALYMHEKDEAVCEIEEISELIPQWKLDNRYLNHVQIPDIGGSSLLAKDSEGRFRFAHRSIMEFLVAEDLFREPRQVKMTDQIINFVLAYLGDSSAELESDAVSGYAVLSATGLGEQQLDLGEGISMHFVLIPAGSFLMGSSQQEQEHHSSESPQHTVTIEKTFYLGKYPVTQGQYERVTKVNPSHFKGPSLPVENVSWEDSRLFCQKLGEMVGKKIRLPTEAEWEYACRAGTTTPFYFGETISTDQANYDGNYVYGKGRKGEYRERTTPVDTFAANAFGLHDMHGNVFEWIEDNWHDSYTDAPSDGRAWVDARRGEYRVVRGGCWRIIPLYCRCAFRYRYHPVNRHHHIGFRLALDFQ
jgi:formylglycine-generating enzyme required for sulfatase activity